MTEYLNNDNSFVQQGRIRNFAFPANERSVEKPSWFRRLVDTVFSTEREKSPELTGRIKQLFEDVHQVKSQLEQIKFELSSTVEEDSLPLVKEVFDPLLREIGKIQKAMTEDELLQRGNVWADNARLWVRIYTEQGDKNEIMQALAQHIISKTHERIDRDVSFIQDYIKQHIDNSELSPSDKCNAKIRFMEHTATYVDRLASLKQAPETTSLKEIGKWKETLDGRRQEILHEALKIIENLSF